MVSQNQSGKGSKKYQSAAHRHVDQWPERMLTKIHPMTAQGARNYWNACNVYDASDEVKEHFKQQMQRFKG